MSRKSNVLALALLLCACATRAAIAQENRATAEPVTAPAPIVNSGQEAVVDRKLAAIAELSVQAGERPPVIKTTGKRGDELLVATAAVEAVLAVKARALEEFRDQRFVVVYQKLSDALAPAGEKDLEYKTAPDGQRAVTSTSFYEVLRKIADLVKNTTNQADVRTTFLVHTDPPGATFEICPQYLTEGCVYVTTDATIAEIYRGLYTYRVLLDGYKTVAFPLDLVHFTQTRLDCHLQAKTASPCTPR